MTDSDRKRITIAILALGGQGGGVLADWILDIGARCGYRTQGTSVPGVAQRTGTTIYYIEMAPDDGRELVMALTPVPGDVDIVIASELMEAGRAMLRGFVTTARTTLITSTHRVYSIDEKSAMGDGIVDGSGVVEKARVRAKRFIGFDMEVASAQSGSVISSVMLGALAGSEALPFPRDSFEAAIKASGIAVDTNLRGFEAGVVGARGDVTMPQAVHHDRPVPTTKAGRDLAERVANALPTAAHTIALHGLQRLMDYQDAAYATLYLERLAKIGLLDDGSDDHALTVSVARHLALWMAYEDTIRVADLKIRASRVERVRSEIRVNASELISITEFMHPRLREICETLPAWLGARILASKPITRLLTPLFTNGRHVETTKMRWFLMLWTLASLRRWRRGTLRYREEQERIEGWLALVGKSARSNCQIAFELSECQRLVKGYGDTFERGLRNYEAVTEIYAHVKSRADAATIIREAREAALRHENGDALAEMLRRFEDAA
jgi:indolepyruvate ferredoxin oxidoreductase beta subunit